MPDIPIDDRPDDIRKTDTDDKPAAQRRAQTLTQAALAATAGASAGAAVQLVESKWKIWREMTAFVFLCMLLYIGANEFISQFRQVQKMSEERDNFNAKELQNIRTQIAENNLRRIEAENKRSEMLTVELRSMLTKLDIISNRIDIANTRMDGSASDIKAAKVAMEKMVKDKK